MKENKRKRWKQFFQTIDEKTGTARWNKKRVGIALGSLSAVILLGLIAVMGSRLISKEQDGEMEASADADLDRTEENKETDKSQDADDIPENADGDDTDTGQEDDEVTGTDGDSSKDTTKKDDSEKDTSKKNTTKKDNSKKDTSKKDSQKDNSSNGSSSNGSSSNGGSGSHGAVTKPDINFAPSEDGSSSSNNSGAESKYPKIAGGKITCDSFGRYTGQYVEDGRDELVESVAAVLVTNRSDEYLEYATLTFDVDGEAANFIVTGLPSGASAWVMDANKLEVKSGASYTYEDCSSSFRSDVDASSDKVGLKADGNMLTATNKTDQTMKNVVVYYRVMHTDGNYLGGITYTVSFDTLEPGESKEVLAGHYSAADSEVVRISWSN